MHNPTRTVNICEYHVQWYGVLQQKGQSYICHKLVFNNPMSSLQQLEVLFIACHCLLNHKVACQLLEFAPTCMPSDVPLLGVCSKGLAALMRQTLKVLSVFTQWLAQVY